MALNPQYAVTPKIGTAVLTTADTALYAPSTAPSAAIVTGATYGTRISKIVVKAAMTTVASVVRLWIHDGTSTYTLFKEVAIPANTSSNTAMSFTSVMSDSTDIDLLPFILPNNYNIRATVSVAHATAGINVLVFGADL